MTNNNKKFNMFPYLSTIGAIFLSIVFVIVLSIHDNFSSMNNLLIVLLILPESIITDYVTNKRNIKPLLAIVAKLTPLLGIVMYSTLLSVQANEEVYNILYGIALTLFACPFFLSSITKENWKEQVKFGFLGFLPVLIAYIYLSFQTDQVYFGVIGTFLYLIHCFMLLIALAYSKKDKYFSIISGLLYAAGLIYLQIGKTDTIYIDAAWDWDWNLSFYFEVLLVLNYVVSIVLISFITYLTERRKLRVTEISGKNL